MDEIRIPPKKPVTAMRKPFYLFLALLILTGAFLGGAWFNQSGANRHKAGTADRRILHYVDPMNPAHTSGEPGIAPCGMPMVPVYTDEEIAGGVLSAAPGGIKISQQKQQIIGVQTDEVRITGETVKVRALGRIVPDENRVHAVVAGTDGWLGKIHGSTTGTLVTRNQLMASIRMYDYDFYTWQQRYISELGSASRRRIFQSPVSDESGQPQTPEVPESTSLKGIPAPSPSPEQPLSQNAGPSETGDSAIDSPRFPTYTGVTQSPPAPGSEDRPVIRRGDLLYISQARQELLDLGLGENQLAELAKSGVYVTHVDLRSPVNGLVLARNVSPNQKIDRGAECFRIADLGTVWVDADLYDIEAEIIRPGVPARVSMPNRKERFAARVSEVLPRFDAAARTLKVRLEMDNPGNRFLPDMFVDVEFLVDLPESITVPSGAVIDSGERMVVYVVVEEGVFEPREVVTGWRFNDRVEISEGLKPGEKFVVSGNFLIDSESRMKMAATKLMEETTENSGDGRAPLPSGPKTPGQAMHHGMQAAKPKNALPAGTSTMQETQRPPDERRRTVLPGSKGGAQP